MTENRGVFGDVAGSSILGLRFDAFGDTFLLQILEQREPLHGQLIVAKTKDPVSLHLVFNKSNGDCILFELCTGVQEG